MVKFLVRLGTFVVIAAVVMEVFFRTLVPASEMPRGFQDREYGVMRLETSSPRSGHNTIGRLGRPGYRWRVNNAGFNSAWEYLPAEERSLPCVAVIGHSYVEGFYSDVEDHMASRLQQRLAGNAVAYNFATSGMPLSQARRVVRFAHDKYAPATYVVFVGFSSLRASLVSLGRVRFAEQVVEDGDGFRRVEPKPLRIDRKRRLLARSAIVRYFFYNANVTFGGAAQRVMDRDTKGEALEKSDPDLLRRATRHILAELRSEVPDANIVMVCDGDRDTMYANHESPPRFATSLILEEICPEFSIRLVDMTDAFWREYQVTGEILNFKDNYHWNPATVDLVARTIIESVGPDFMTGATRGE